MKNNNVVRLILFLVLLLSVNAWSVDKGLYVVGQVGRADIKISNEFLEFNSPAFEEDTYSFNAALGYRPVKHLGLELGKYAIGTIEDAGDSRVDFSGLYLALAGSLAISDDWYLMGKIGAMDWDAGINQVNTSQDLSKDDSSTMYSIGFAWAFRRDLDLVANHMFVDADGLEINATSLGIVVKF